MVARSLLRVDMDTWADLQASILSETNREGEPGLSAFADQITRDRIRHYQREFFWATPVQIIVSCVPGMSMYPLPDTIVSVSSIRLQNGGTWQPMGRSTFEDLLAMDTQAVPSQSVPALYAPWDNLIRIFQVPDRAYPMEWTGKGRIPIPDRDDRVNFWTSTAADLIRCTALAHIFLRRFKNPGQYQSYMLAATEYLTGLKRETISKTTNGIVAANW